MEREGAAKPHPERKERAIVSPTLDEVKKINELASFGSETHSWSKKGCGALIKTPNIFRFDLILSPNITRRWRKSSV